VTGQPTEGWAFLVARGYVAGYQLLLVPDFIKAAGEAALLMDEVRGEVPMQAPPVVSDIVGPVSGPLCVVHRTIRAMRADIGEADRPEGLVLDRVGRPIILAYGFVCRGSRVLTPHEDDMRVARAAAVATYRRFHAAERTFRAEISGPYVVHSIVAPVEEAVSGLSAPVPGAPVSAAPSSVISRSPAPWTSQVLPDSQQSDKGPRRPPALVIALTVVLILLGLAGGSYLLVGGNVQVRVPDVVKMSIRAAEQEITKDNLTWSISCQGATNGTVTGTEPAAGKLVNKGSDVSLLVYPCSS